jgi:type II secretory pathway component GspD/PulD (secretin)
MIAIASSATLALLLLVAQSASTEDDPRVVSQADIVLEPYRIQHADPRALYNLVSGLAGRTYFVREHGGFQADEISNLQLLGDSLVLYDTAKHVQRVREILARLDVPGEVRAARTETREYAPRFLSIASVYAAVSALVDVSVLTDQGKAVLRGSGANMEEALALLERLDRPDPQVLLTCHLLELTEQTGGPALPRELADNLQKLLPGSAFTQVGMALLKTSVGGEPLAVQIESTGKRYRLSFTPAAFDAASGALTARGCMLVEERDGGAARELFRTDAVLHAGEYTVLAATGATPRLLVVRVTPQD